MKLESLRKEIDAIDVELQELITKRAQLGVQVGQIKNRQDNPQFFVPERESKILNAVIERNKNGLLSDKDMIQIFREIISATRALEDPIRIAILGPEGTFTQAAAHSHFGHSFDTVYRPTINDVFSAVELEKATYGVVPVENSIEGVVNSTLDRLFDSPLQLCGEIELRVEHALLSQADDLSDVRKVMAHPQALAQCSNWLSRNLPDVELIPVSSNAKAVDVIRNDADSAAIASVAAAEIYHVGVLRTNIEDRVGNTTRFLIIGKIATRSTGYDKTSILVSKKNEVGSLVELLEPFARLGVNMSKIESRPSGKAMWEYVFFIDFEGHVDDENIKQLFEELKQRAPLFKLLGSYPRSVS
ncbi:MAG: prephenate dehydratase [Acidiferrobacterales bacterium]|nr:prephenate dehydratase [Acidiferrobacterales bacterium]